MKTKIRTVHEEQYGSKGKILGVLENYELNGNWKESFIYIYEDNMYIIFDTIIEMNEYLLYGDDNIKRAYLDENEFDEYYDSETSGKFVEILDWN